MATLLIIYFQNWNLIYYVQPASWHFETTNVWSIIILSQNTNKINQIKSDLKKTQTLQKTKGQWRLDNAETLVTLGTKDTGQGQTQHKNTTQKTKRMNNTMSNSYSLRVGHRCTQTNTNNIDKIWQTTVVKDEPNIVFMRKP
jgi:hypothetical protein